MKKRRKICLKQDNESQDIFSEELTMLEYLTVRNVNNKTRHFFTNKDKKRLRQFRNISGSITLSLFIFFTQLLKWKITNAIILSLSMGILNMLICIHYTRSKIIEKHQKFEEKAFLILNSLSINMTVLSSFPHALENIIEYQLEEKNYQKTFQKAMFKLNIGNSKEDQVIEEISAIFLNEKYRRILRNIKKQTIMIESEPEFLLNIKREIAFIEDNITIFIAVSCLFPLVLSLIISLIVPYDSLLIILFPVFYGFFGTYILQYIQNKTVRGNENEIRT